MPKQQLGMTIANRVWGDDFLSELAAGFAQIGSDPQLFPRLERYSGPHDVRRYILKRFPYLVVFNGRGEESLVIAFAHGRRKPLYWLNRLA